MAELVDARDLKSLGALLREGSSPSPGTSDYPAWLSDSPEPSAVIERVLRKGAAIAAGEDRHALKAYGYTRRAFHLGMPFLS